MGTGVGGICQSFLVLNRFSEANAALGQGVLCLSGALGMSSSGQWLEFCGTSANCPIANLYTVTGIESAVDLTIGVWVLTVANMGVGAVDVGVESVGWASTLTLYHLLATMVLLLSSGTFVLGAGDFLPGVGNWLGWSWLVLLQLSWLWLGLGLGPGLGTKSFFQFQVCSHLLDKGGVRTELCAPGITPDYLGCPVSSECMNALHGLYFHFHIYHFCR